MQFLKNRRKYILIQSAVGQLGNHLIQFANFIVYAKENNYILHHPCFGEYAKYFDYTDQQIWCRYPYSIRKEYKSKQNIFREKITKLIKFVTGHPIIPLFFYTKDKIYKRIGILPSVFISHLSLGTKDECDLDNPEDPLLKKGEKAWINIIGGWRFRSVQYFDKYADELRRLFTPKEKYLNNINKLIKKAYEDVDVLIGVHIRQGDYRIRTHKNFRFFYSKDQYIQKMKETLNLFPGKKIRFLVCSDEDYSERDFEGLNVIMGNGKPLEDMYSLARCDYIIGPPSSFTAWASFYGRKPLYHIIDPFEKIKLEKFDIFDAQAFIERDRL